MDTVIHRISSVFPENFIIEEAASVLRGGGVVAFPTETVYGLGADALNPDAIKKIFLAKGRPSDNPLIVHIASTAQMYELGRDISRFALSLSKAFMPGPLTLVVKRNPIIPEIVTAGLDTVALRMPDHPVPLALVTALKHGIVGPSANLSGKPSPTTAQHVIDDLNGTIEMVLDAGPTQIGVESTVVDTTGDLPVILRPGGITREQIEEIVGEVRTSAEIHELKRSPGTRHRHYAPRAKVLLIEPGNTQQFQQLWNESCLSGKKVRAIVYSAAMLTLADSRLFDVLPETVEGYTQQIFSSLRRLDDEGADIILIEAVNDTGLGAAVMDRLQRAAEATGLQ